MNQFSGVGAIASGIGDLFSSNPADAASQYYNQIPNELKDIYSPYINNGNSAYSNLNKYMNYGTGAGSTLNQQFQQLAQNPTFMMNKIGSTYQQSPGYQWNVNQALGAANRAAAAGGMAGSPMEQQQLASTVTGLANQDYYNYLNHGLNQFNTGLQGLLNMYNTGAGIGQNIYDTGASMANSYGQNLAAAQMNQGNLAYAGQINQNESLGGGLGSIASGLF